jgi:hypothetical protein
MSKHIVASGRIWKNFSRFSAVCPTGFLLSMFPGKDGYQAVPIPEAKTGWGATKTACCNSRGRIDIGHRHNAESWCGRTSTGSSPFTIADSAYRSAKLCGASTQRSRGRARPLPLQPHPRKRFRRQRVRGALLPPIILGGKAGSL